MTRRVFHSTQARADILEIVDFLTGVNPLTAAKFTGAVRRTEEAIAFAPEAGAPRSFGDPRLLHLRMTPVREFRNWLVFYVPHAHGIELLRVLHGARDVERLLRGDDSDD